MMDSHTLVWPLELSEEWESNTHGGADSSVLDANYSRFISKILVLVYLEAHWLWRKLELPTGTKVVDDYELKADSTERAVRACCRDAAQLWWYDFVTTPPTNCWPEAPLGGGGSRRGEGGVGGGGFCLEVSRWGKLGGTYPQGQALVHRRLPLPPPPPVALPRTILPC